MCGVSPIPDSGPDGPDAECFSIDSRIDSVAVVRCDHGLSRTVHTQCGRKQLYLELALYLFGHAQGRTIRKVGKSSFPPSHGGLLHESEADT